MHFSLSLKDGTINKKTNNKYWLAKDIKDTKSEKYSRKSIMNTLIWTNILCEVFS